MTGAQSGQEDWTRVSRVRSPRLPTRQTPTIETVTTVHETSAGGLILDAASTNSRAAIIGKTDRAGRMTWTLPKGHVESGESFPETAIREVEEETGIHGEVLGPLGSLDYWFVAAQDGEDHRIHKVVHHFLLVRTSGALSDEDPEVEEVAWVPFSELSERLTYANERKIVAAAPALLDGPG